MFYRLVLLIVATSLISCASAPHNQSPPDQVPFMYEVSR